MSFKNSRIYSEPILEPAQSCALQEKRREEVNRCSKQRVSNLVF